MDIAGRQLEFGGSPEFEPANRLLIDPVLQFHPWDLWIQQEFSSGRFPWWTSLSGSGAPFAANGQSRLFDPLHLVFLQLPLPWAWAAESSVRFIIAGYGFYLLCRLLGLGAIACWFCPLAINLTGFFTLWRQYPLVATGSLLPWLLWSSLRLRLHFSMGRWAGCAVVSAWVIVSGNIQVAAIEMVMAFGLSLFAIQKSKISYLSERIWHPQLPAVSAVSSALFCGVLVSAPAWVSLWGYLQESPILADRVAEHSAGGRGSTARWADLPCLVSPFFYGSERQGDANLHKSIGASNISESASGFVGLTGLILILSGCFTKKKTHPDQVRMKFGFFAIFLLSFWVGYRLPPVVWLWPRLPLLSVIDPRRFLVGMPLAGLLLAGLGLQSLASGQVSAMFDKWLPRLILLLAIGHLMAATLPFAFSEKIEMKAAAHYGQSVEPGPEHRAIVQHRVQNQMHAITHAWPLYVVGRSLVCLLVLAAWWFAQGRPRRRAIFLATIAFAELIQFGWNYNPHVKRNWLNAIVDAKLAHELRSIASVYVSKGYEARFLALGEALPPNQLMAMGLKDLRNYDSIELLAGLKPFEVLLDRRRAGDRTSRIDLGWRDITEIAEPLRRAGVAGVLARSRPADGLFEKIAEVVPGLWIGLWPGVPRVEGDVEKLLKDEPGRFEIRARTEPLDGSILIRENFAKGWSAKSEKGDFLKVEADKLTGFIRIKITADHAGQMIVAVYRPTQLKAAIYGQFAGILLCLFVAGGRAMLTHKKIGAGASQHNDSEVKIKKS
ncbi:MAG: hypothetical protein ACKO85_20340 [Isosphaeraceae bacterium]